jgi:hypothetical protein
VHARTRDLALSRLNRALDELATRFGPDAVRPVGAGDVSRAGLSLSRKRGEDPRED